jgi:FkbM family methyltransferase
MIFSRQHAINNPELQSQEKLLQQLFHQNDALTILDIGACEGESSIRYSKLFPQATIYSFEPIPSNFKQLQNNIQEYHTPHIIPFEFCLSDKTGNATMHVSSGKPKEFEQIEADWDFGNKSSSLLQPDKALDYYGWLSFNQSCEVHAIRLDEFCRNHNIMNIDFIHMDVQGAEIMVLKGAGQTMDHIKNIWLEVSNVALYAGQPLQKDIEAFLQSNGFAKLIDTVDDFSGDQFWCKATWVEEKMGTTWFEKNIWIQRTIPKPTLVERIRAIFRLKTRLRKLLHP